MSAVANLHQVHTITALACCISCTAVWHAQHRFCQPDPTASAFSSISKNMLVCLKVGLCIAFTSSGRAVGVRTNGRILLTAWCYNLCYYDWLRRAFIACNCVFSSVNFIRCFCKLGVTVLPASAGVVLQTVQYVHGVQSKRWLQCCLQDLFTTQAWYPGQTPGPSWSVLAYKPGPLDTCMLQQLLQLQLHHSTSQRHPVHNGSPVRFMIAFTP